jgi:hypothetical protein
MKSSLGAKYSEFISETFTSQFTHRTVKILVLAADFME